MSRVSGRELARAVERHGWQEDFLKLTGCRRFVEERFGQSLEAMMPQVLFCGDSPNDEDLFGAFETSCAVANISDFADLMTHQPTYVTTLCGAHGFAELTSAILHARRA